MWGMQTFDNYPVFQPGQVVDALPVWLGRENEVMATVSEEVSLTLPKTSFKGLRIDIQYDSPIAAPIAKDAVIGKMIITLPSFGQPLEIP